MALPWPAIVTIRSHDAGDRLASRRLRVSVRNGNARLGLHLHNTVADVDRALDALT